MILELPRRLSRSLIWRLQRRYFEHHGLAAWGTDTVPHYITNTPVLADRYVRVVRGFVEDLALAPSQPVQVVELGAGTGRLAFHFVRAWARQTDRPIRYLMTDFDGARLPQWRAHPRLRPLIDAGGIDVAKLDVETEALPGDLISGAPIVVIANYVFDSLPQDCFYVDHGQLHDALVTTSGDSDALERLTLSYQRGAACDVPYGEPLLDAILDGYRRRLEAAVIPFPTSALRCVERLVAAAEHRMLLIAADNGPIREAALRDEPEMTLHGSFSMPVNFHAIGEAFRALGGAMFATRAEADYLQICAFALDRSSREFPATGAAFEDAIDRHGPDRFYAAKNEFLAAHRDWSLSAILELLQASGWDPTVFLGCSRRLTELAVTAEEPDRARLAGALAQVWDAYFPIGEATDLAFHAGVLAATLRLWPEAERLFRWSIASHGADLSTVVNLAVCEHRQGRSRDARDRLRHVLDASPRHRSANALLAEIDQPSIGEPISSGRSKSPTSHSASVTRWPGR